MEVTTIQLQEVFGIKSRATFTKWRKQGAEEAYTGRNKWDLGNFIDWWAENIFYPKDSKGIADARQRWEEARAQKLEFEVEKMKGEYLPRDEMIEALNELIVITKKAFMLLPKNATFPLDEHVLKDHIPDVVEILTQMTDYILIGLAERATISEVEAKLKAIKK